MRARDCVEERDQGQMQPDKLVESIVYKKLLWRMRVCQRLHERVRVEQARVARLFPNDSDRAAGHP